MAVRILSEGRVSQEERTSVLRLAVPVWIQLRQVRRAWAGLNALAGAVGDSDPWVRLHREVLLVEHGQSSIGFRELRECVRALPHLRCGWQLLAQRVDAESRLGWRREAAIGSMGRHATAEQRLTVAEGLAAGELWRDVLLVLGEDCVDGSPREWSVRAHALLGVGDLDGLRRVLTCRQPRSLDEAIWMSKAWLRLQDEAEAYRVLDQWPDVDQHCDFVRWNVAMALLEGRLGCLEALCVRVRKCAHFAVDAVWARVEQDFEWIADRLDLDDCSYEPALALLRAEALAFLNRREEGRRRFAVLRGQVGDAVPAMHLAMLLLDDHYESLQYVEEQFSAMEAQFAVKSVEERLAAYRSDATRLLALLGPARDRLLTWRGGDGRLRVHYAGLNLRSRLAGCHRLLFSHGMDEALEAMTDLVQAYPNAGLPLCYRAELHLWRGDLECADADLGRAVEVDGLVRWARVGAMIVAMARGRFTWVTEEYRMLYSVMGELPAAWPVVGEALLHLSRRVEALDFLNRDLQRRPTRLSSWLLFALASDGVAEVPEMILHRILLVYPRLGDVCTGCSVVESLERIRVALLWNRSSQIVTWSGTDGELRGSPAVTLFSPEETLNLLRQSPHNHRDGE